MTNSQSTTHTTTEPWGTVEKQLWLAQQNIQRSYFDDVVSKINQFKDRFEVEQYGELSFDPAKYPLFIVKSKNWHATHPTVLITGGVHGYETSGVHGALSFLQNEAASYASRINLIVAPCISPWGYETINRWNPQAIDPNRSFYADGPSQEASALMAYVASLQTELVAHIDLHETTDTDNSVFRPALAARDGIKNTNWNIPDGFYLVGDLANPQHDFQQAIIKSVEKVTHIAPADPSGKIIGEKLSQHGVINYANQQLGLCAGLSNAKYVTTTEVYPDSPKANDKNCIEAQVAAVIGGLDYILAL